MISIAFICSILIYLEDLRSNNIINKSNFTESITESLQTPKEDLLDNQMKISMIKSIKF